MAGFLQKLLEALGGKQPSTRRKQPGAHRRASAHTGRCVQCGSPLSLGVSRCPNCGRRTSVSLERPAVERPPEVPSNLSDLQVEVLIAAAESRDSLIHVHEADADEGEIEAGPVRLTGDEAVAAVRRLLRAGFVAIVDESSYTLTPDGVRVAKMIREHRD